jgi:hypothetical protein
MITLQLVDSVKDIEADINAAIAKHLNTKLSNAKTTLERKIKEYVGIQINNSYEMIELRGGYLQGALGVLEPVSAVEDIVSAVESSVKVNVTKYNAKLKGGIEIYVQPSNFANLLSLPTGNTVIDGGVLHWLRWLLEFGDRIIVVGYDYSPESGLGRTGLGTMDKGGAFRIPPAFAGVPDDNFITRSIVTRQTDIFLTKIIEDTLR